MDTEKPNRHRPVLRRIVIDLAIMSVIGIVLALIGPFGSFNDPLPIRLMVWLGFSYLGYALYSPMGFFVDKLHALLDLPRAGLWVAACMVATIPMSLAVWSLNFVFRPFEWPTAEQALVTYLYVLVVGGGITVLFQVIGHHQDHPGRGAAVADNDAPRQSPSRFLDRLPPALGTDLLALEMEDHYVRVHTALGSDLVLLRLRDAIAELDGLEGMQVHRSWWVARHAVADVKREGRNVRLMLEGGLEAPVSRANVQPLKDAGWF
ncbi:LytTR family DNA-binding domain-containing protein [Parerythrobacter aestuarii]|uniref:LytTR family DNA-binding domain-containing protein n=1 Tax=Parerythrobacter aestuarii TaxID=3020909 RepID=UPI0024DEF080|nr:LytTR family DNA-binding domain-containing protein [Parerythrobacter aestuarii]